MKRRLFALVFAVLLPLQLVWAAAAGYCQHETTRQGAQHLGHHAHVHADAKPDLKPQGGKLLPDLDCEVCHLPLMAVLPALAALPLRAPAAPSAFWRDPRPPTAPQQRPERPQWPRLA